jgi:membrane-associated protein
MEFIQIFIEFFLHIDQHLNEIIQSHGTFTYVILFAVVFMETGFVVTPFLPGDSLLFAVGSFAALGSLNVYACFWLLFAAAVIGDTVNYWAGNFIGPKVFEKDYRFLKKKHLIRTQKFYEKHGGKTIIIARFVPIVRTFAPFIAGVGTMNYPRFISYNIFGGFLWTALFIFGGYFFGNIPFVKKNFEFVILGIIFVSVLPIIVEFLRSRYKGEESDPIS